MAAILKSSNEIRTMRDAGRVVGQVLQILTKEVRPGVTPKHLDQVVRAEYARRNAIPTFLHYAPGNAPPYPATVCISVNDEIVHGIPGNRPFKDGDIVSIDLGATVNGFVGDAAITVPCGLVTDVARRLIQVTEEALWVGIGAARAGVHLGDVGAAIQSYAESHGYSVVREYVGHGVGRRMHEDPQVPNHGKRGQGLRLKKGLVIAIEPMVNVCGPETRQLPDRWTVATADGSLSAHFEHTIAITDGDANVLTMP
ncbi:MAG: type I methionyl aminopeptidase [Dehalococcoidia bacterium]